jgi:hypothetical protein
VSFQNRKHLAEVRALAMGIRCASRSWGGAEAEELRRALAVISPTDLVCIGCAAPFGPWTDDELVRARDHLRDPGALEFLADRIAGVELGCHALPPRWATSGGSRALVNALRGLASGNFREFERAVRAMDRVMLAALLGEARSVRGAPLGSHVIEQVADALSSEWVRARVLGSWKRCEPATSHQSPQGVAA